MGHHRTESQPLDGLTLRTHPLALLREEYPFSHCKRACDLPDIGHHRFVRLAFCGDGHEVTAGADRLTAWLRARR